MLAYLKITILFHLSLYKHAVGFILIVILFDL